MRRFQRSDANKRPATGGLSALCGRAFHICLRLLGAATVLALIAAVLLVMRLQAGPIHLTWGARQIEAELNQDRDDAVIEIGDLVLRLPDGSLRPLVEFQDVTIRNAAGSPIIAAPALRARLSVPDLINGEIKPTSVVIVGPEARLIRTGDGRFRVGLGYTGGIDITGGTTQVGPQRPRRKIIEEDPGMASLARIFLGFAGDREPVPGLDALREVGILDARLTYLHVPTARVWHTTNSDLFIRKNDDGVNATLTMEIAEPDRPGARLAALAFRPSDSRITTAHMSIDGLDTAELATQVPGLDALRLIDARVHAELTASFDPAGQPTRVEGEITSTDGTIFGIDEVGEPFDRFYLSFSHRIGTDRVRVEDLQLEARATSAYLSGFADLERDAGGAVVALLGQVDVRGLRLDLPRLFEGELRFTDGQVVGRLQLDPLEIRVADARLSDTNLALSVAGIARQRDGMWQTDLRASGKRISVGQMISHWPLPAAVNAREWVADNLLSGTIDELVAHLRIDRGEPQLNLDFRYSDLVSGYLDRMTPISGARGTGHLTLHEFYLFMDEGGVTTGPGSRIRLTGSRVTISDLWGEVTPADIRIAATGPTNGILGLIDEPPLGLVGKLGLSPDAVDGSASLTARLNFPLLQDLRLEQIDAAVDAKLEAVEMPLAFAGRGDLTARSPELSLGATTHGMRVKGPVEVNGLQATVDWTEHYDETPGRREVAVTAAVSPQQLAVFGWEPEQFSAGVADTSLTFSQIGDGPAAFDLDLDLARAELAVPEIGWHKPASDAATLRAEGKFGEALEITQLGFAGAGLSFDGSLRLAADGSLSEVRLARFQLRDAVDVAIDVSPNPAGGLSVTMQGRYLDTALLSGGDSAEPEAQPSDPLTIDLALQTLRLTPDHIVAGTRGRILRTSSGDLVADLSGSFNGRAPVTVSLSAPRSEVADLFIESEDAGAFVKALGISDSSSGGTLDLRAKVSDFPDGRIDGTVDIRNISIEKASTFEIILREGGIGDEGQSPVAGGLRFREVLIPFTYAGKAIEIGPSLATGPSLALKFEGEVEPSQRMINLTGLISPAYALSKGLNNIPLLGRILTGGEGEGILAMTFSVRGDIDNPEISVNPLTLLTPGFLRNVFSGKSRSPDTRFLEQLERD